MRTRLLHLLQKMKGVDGEEEEEKDAAADPANTGASSSDEPTTTKPHRNYRGDYLTFGRQVSVSWTNV